MELIIIKDGTNDFLVKGEDGFFRKVNSKGEFMEGSPVEKLEGLVHYSVEDVLANKWGHFEETDYGLSFIVDDGDDSFSFNVEYDEVEVEVVRDVDLYGNSHQPSIKVKEIQSTTLYYIDESGNEYFIGKDYTSPELENYINEE